VTFPVIVVLPGTKAFSPVGAGCDIRSHTVCVDSESESELFTLGNDKYKMQPRMLHTIQYATSCFPGPEQAGRLGYIRTQIINT
jgi:hypothetical protein